jgi:hypothetical protein
MTTLAVSPTSRMFASGGRARFGVRVSADVSSISLKRDSVGGCSAAFSGGGTETEPSAGSATLVVDVPHEARLA